MAADVRMTGVLRRARRRLASYSTSPTSALCLPAVCRRPIRQLVVLGAAVIRRQRLAIAGRVALHNLEDETGMINGTR
jgi:hypothetical protein